MHLHDHRALYSVYEVHATSIYIKEIVKNYGSQFTLNTFHKQTEIQWAFHSVD